jgi:FixJ family two-component response regulator
MLNLEIDRSIPLVGIVDRDQAVVQGLGRVTERLGMSLQGAATVAELRNRVPTRHMAALILALDTDAEEGARLQRELLEQDAGTMVALTTTLANSHEVTRGLILGAVRVLQRPWDTESITQFLKLAHGQFREHQSHQEKLADFRRCLAELTPRQLRVLELASTGMSNKLIAGQIDVSQRTVEAERSRLLEVFGSNSCSDAMVRLGEFRVLEQVERMRKRLALQRLNSDRLTSLQPGEQFFDSVLAPPLGDADLLGCLESSGSERGL